MANQKINRNDACPCGSGKKYKQCCQNNMPTNNTAAQNRLLESIPDLFKQAVKLQLENQRTIAETLYQQILDINPKHSGSLHNLGLMLRRKGELEQSAILLQKLVKTDPTAAHYCSLADVLAVQNKHEEAIFCYQKAIILNPGDCTAYNNLGTLFWSLLRYDEAIIYYEKTISLNTNHDSALGNIGLCLIAQGNYKRAAYYLRKATLAAPMASTHYSNLLYCLCFDESAFPDIYLQEAKRLDIALKNQYPQPYTHAKTRSDKTTLRIGFVSGDLKNHPVGYFLESILSKINKQHFELIAYKTTYFEDDLSARIKPFFTLWLDISQLNDSQAAEQIYNDKIDILIDLSGHTAMNRLPVFAIKPAPVQVSWLGYWASTGLSCIDYLITDPISTPPELQSQFTEKLYYLPDTRLCFTPPHASVTPKVDNLIVSNEESITFACFQNLSKINEDVIKLWAKILQLLPKSQLLIKNKQLKNNSIKEDFIKQLTHLNAPMDRVTLQETSPRAEYLSTYNRVDIMLDTFPYPGGTTTCEALWMGVPTLTLTGNTLLARQGVSMLSCVGLNDWIAQDKEDYVQKAVTFANNKALLCELKQNLRTVMQASPLVDAKHFADNLEKVFFAMWQDKMSS